jgi:hypothetical protein
MKVYKDQLHHEDMLKTNLVDLTKMDQKVMDDWLCKATTQRIQYLHFLKTKEAINPDYMLNDFLRFLPEHYQDHHTYVLEYNFTAGCHVMPWYDKHVRVVYHQEFGPGNQFYGVETIRPRGIFNQTSVISRNITRIDLRK